jgi:hypothetical protein
MKGQKEEGAARERRFGSEGSGGMERRGKVEEKGGGKDSRTRAGVQKVCVGFKSVSTGSSSVAHRLRASTRFSSARGGRGVNDRDEG